MLHEFSTAVHVLSSKMYLLNLVHVLLESTAVLLNLTYYNSSTKFSNYGCLQLSTQSHEPVLVRTIKFSTGSLRSTCTYIGASRVKDIPKCTTFMMVNRQVNTIHNGKEV